ncbi:Piwi-domain-containing protein [Basidiobolus meristosporus CBS 931.73]|uniref:Piwi-domain-containing protein n=1 Tax=Basidiobolus meristosporus CBS 931.73 TaxID=1314790 RepID=A0A1Y1XCA2_9FUNG|nr:Piwi-domain-containing protein [Basidiobolus meristosporus CBS 931.73]|eukprot:ORX83400.1 Piwi-domain-containing protein [Basidiobolus meristosporus CBS 931.73]
MEGNAPTSLVLRPGVCGVGKIVRVETNHCKFSEHSQVDIYQYDLSIMPEIRNPKVARLLFDEMQKRYKDSLCGEYSLVYDFARNVYSNGPLPFGQSMSVEVDRMESSLVSPATQCTIKIVQVAVIPIQALLEFLNGRSDQTSASSSFITAMNVLFKYHTSLDHFTWGNSIFRPGKSFPLGGGLEAWRGIHQSVKPTKGQLLLNINSTATAFYTPGPLLDSIVNVLGRRSPRELRQGFAPEERSRLVRFFKGVTIRTTHRGEKNFQYKFEGLTEKGADQTFFPSSDDQMDIGVSTYFHQTYNLRLNHPGLPCVLVKKGRVFLPIEVCEVVRGLRYNSARLSDEHISNMIKFSALSPSKRINEINDGIRTLIHNNGHHLSRFGVKVENRMMDIESRILDPPTLQFHESTPDFTPGSGVWNMNNRRLYRTVPLVAWSIVNFASRAERQVQSFLGELINTGRQMGMAVEMDSPAVLQPSREDTIEEILKNAWYRAHHQSEDIPQMILCILPARDPQLYSEIKQVSETSIGVITQCVVARSALSPGRGYKMYLSNLWLKINTKLGGINVRLSPRSNLSLKLPSVPMIVGIDLSHPGPYDKLSPTTAAMVASIDSSFTRYVTSFRAQEPRKETLSDVESMMSELLVLYRQECGSYPEQIIIYRDGVSEGQFEEVKLCEIRPLHELFQKRKLTLKVTYIVARKRHHTLFFPTERAFADNSGNCRPGTLVDTTVTHPNEFDFYLQSHAGIQGTSRPCHYYVIYDDYHFTAEELQTLTFKLCFIYCRSTRSTSIPAPQYYAHLAASRAQLHFRNGQWNDPLSESGQGLQETYKGVKHELKTHMFYV